MNMNALLAMYLPILLGSKKGIDIMNTTYEPMDTRLQKVNLEYPTEGVKESNDKTNTLFEGFRLEREKIAGDLPSIFDILMPHTAGGVALHSTLQGLGGVATPVSQVAGYNMYKSLFPGLKGMMSYTAAPEKAVESFAGNVGGSFGNFAAEGLQKVISNVMKKNQQMMFDSPRRKAIFDALVIEDDIINKMDQTRALEAYHSMAKIAPTLSTDKNAVKSFLRSVAASPEGGIDWNTLKGMADAEVSILKAQGIKEKK